MKNCDTGTVPVKAKWNPSWERRPIWLAGNKQWSAAASPAVKKALILSAGYEA
ncbi:MAG: hypothetical protein K8T91_11020 [Planctomycetes bacterium]|nr:hypothetical protein [Planctomycetota bacterium]